MTKTTGLRVLTMNVLSPDNPDWVRRRPVLTAAIGALNPDVLALQEVRVADAAALVADMVGEGYSVRGFSATSENGVGAVTATRWPHQVVAEIDQRLTPRSRLLPWTATLVMEMSTPVGPLLVAHHKPSWPFGFELEREQQALLAARRLEELAAGRSDLHVVVLGDFDATPDAGSVQFWRGRRSLEGTSVGYQDAWETVYPDDSGWTFSAENPLVRAGEVATAISRRIDYVLVRCGLHGPTLQVRACARVLDGPVDGIWASDHYGVVADLASPDHPPGTWAPQ